MVSVIKRPISDVEDVERILIMQEKGTVQHAVLVDLKGSGPTAGRIKNSMDTD